MDFEWQTHAPADVTSPFHKLAMEHNQNGKKSIAIHVCKEMWADILPT